MLLFFPNGVTAAVRTQQIIYHSTISSGVKGPYQLKAEINYPAVCSQAPIAIVLHGFSSLNGNFTAYRVNARYLAQSGFFTITPALRGRDGSDGTRDCGGLEVYDVYDAVEFVKKQYASLVDSTNVHIVGYSGGGGLALLAVCRFPDYFRLITSFSGMSDYGYDSTSSWFVRGATANHQRILSECIGDPRTRTPRVLDRYLARSARFGAPNYRETEMHLFVNRNEPYCPVEQDSLFMVAAQRTLAPSALYTNINLHIGYPRLFKDFNNNSRNDNFEEQYWPHYRQSVRDLRAAMGWYSKRLRAGEIPLPILPDSGVLYVPGYVVTKKFSVWLGTGENAAGTCVYSLSDNEKIFRINLVTSDTSVLSKLTVDCRDMQLPITIVHNDSVVTRNFQSATYVCKFSTPKLCLRILSR